MAKSVDSLHQAAGYGSSEGTDPASVSAATTNPDVAPFSNVNATTDVVANVDRSTVTGNDSTTSAMSSDGVDRCVVRSVDPFLHNVIRQMVREDKVNLIEYRLVFPAYVNRSTATTDDGDGPSSPLPIPLPSLFVNSSRVFRGDLWSRVSTQHGQTLLSLAFNYGVLSMMTLSIGTSSLEVALDDEPIGCLAELNEDAQLDLLLQLLMRDFEGSASSSSSSAAAVAAVTASDVAESPSAAGPSEGVRVRVRGQERICYEAIVADAGRARFMDRCCFESAVTGEIECITDIGNVWLDIVQLALSVVRIAVLIFGPTLFTGAVVAASRKRFPYLVRLKEPLEKTIYLAGSDGGGGGVAVGGSDPLSEGFDGQRSPLPKYRRSVDLRSAEGFPKLRECLSTTGVPVGRPVRVRFSQYDILVGYKRLLTENAVPVGFWHSIASNVFLCRLRNVGPFRACCRTNMFRSCATSERTLPLPTSPWIKFWSNVGLVLLVVAVPSPYYLRLFVYYLFERKEVMARKATADRLGLAEAFGNSPLHYFTPTHPLFVFIYVVYFLTAIVVALTSSRRHGEEGPLVRIVAGSFDDLKNLPWTRVLHVMVGNVIWPFRRYGIVGCAVAVVYWPLALPLTVLLYGVFCLPTVYLTLRMIFYSRQNFLHRRVERRTRRRSYRARRRPDDSIELFNIERFFPPDDGGIGRRSKDRTTPTFRTQASVEEQRGPLEPTSPIGDDPPDLVEFDKLIDYKVRGPTADSISQGSSVASSTVTTTSSLRLNCFRCVEHFAASMLCVVALYSVLIILSECIGCAVELAVFTMMGVIVNAAVLLKYVALVILLVVYSYDCFNNVQKNYLKLNKALFAEVKSRIRDLEKVTSLPSYLQENVAFKSQELSEQAEHETPDDVAARPARHWLINDLVLFVDNEDMPRVPRKLFEEICEIRVAGVPGPVYRGHLLALRQFLKLVLFVVFVFVVVLSFGDAYRMSSTNQMLATLAGGFLPLILRTMMGVQSSDIELGTLSFRSKLDEVIQNYRQYWPIYDLQFETVPTTTSHEPTTTADDISLTEVRKDIGAQETAGMGGSLMLKQNSDNNHTSDEHVVKFVQDSSDVENEKVDILIQLPDWNEGCWISEWSDMQT